MVIVVVGVFIIYLLFLFVLGYFCLQMVNDCEESKNDRG